LDHPKYQAAVQRPENRLSEAQQKFLAKIVKLCEAHFRSRSLNAGITKTENEDRSKKTSKKTQSNHRKKTKI